MRQLNFGHEETRKYDGSTAESWYDYTCGHCGTKVSGAVIAAGINRHIGTVETRWLQCPSCYEGSVQVSGGEVYPGVPFGPVLEGLPPETESAYSEARRCLSVNADTAAEVMCRKILMHIAVDKGASEGKSFASYIDYLAKEGYVTPPMEPWVKLIKDHGNMANHELEPPDRRRAEGTLLFTVQLLRAVYEMGHMAQKFIPANEGEDVEPPS
jgi:hypothetical protein